MNLDFSFWEITFYESRFESQFKGTFSRGGPADSP
jgi:hypothetical protein